MPEKKKMGRPTEAVKDTQLNVRMDKQTLAKLDEYCAKRGGIPRPQGIREAVKFLPDNPENKK